MAGNQELDPKAAQSPLAATATAAARSLVKQGPHNPPSNIIPAGVSEEELLSAVSKSGYPLQTIVANLLRKDFNVQEEWSYLDKETRELRAIDIHAQAHLYRFDSNPRVRPTLNLLVECKQSDMPYVFFLSQNRVLPSDFPVFAGLFDHSIELTTDDEPGTFGLRIVTVLGLESQHFLASGPPHCMSFARCIRKGKDVELSGSEPFSGLVLPLSKAMHHFQITEEPPKTALYFDLHVAIGLAVLGAPMVGVHVKEASNELELLPWVRVVRHESLEASDWWKRARLFAIDVVHKDFLTQYVAKELLPFAREFSVRALRHDVELSSGKGFAPSLGKGGWANIEQHLRPRR